MILDYITISPTTGGRYICDSRDANSRKVTITVSKDETIEMIVSKLVDELEPSDKEIYQLKEETAKANEQNAELMRIASELEEANRNAAKTLAAIYDDESKSKYITWQDAIKKGFLNPGELVFFKGKMYTVISPTGTGKGMEPTTMPNAYLDVSDSIKKSDLKKEKPDRK